MKLYKYNNAVRYDFLVLITSLMIFSCSAFATEFVYISDHLRVGVRTEPVSSDLPVGVVFTGMRLEVKERSEGYVKIVTNKGMTGWIKDIYVTSKPPATIQLSTIREKYDKLKMELSQGNDTTSSLEDANRVLNEQLEELKNERYEWKRERAISLASEYTDNFWFWIILLIVLSVTSFIAGAVWYRTKAMNRLGGLRV